MDVLIELILAIPFAILEGAFGELWARTKHISHQAWRIMARVGLVVALLAVVIGTSLLLIYLLACLLSAIGCDQGMA